ncbi:MAG: hypothetical protein ACLQDL_04190, partial [Spirochaetia bacterium]
MQGFRGRSFLGPLVYGSVVLLLLLLALFARGFSRDIGAGRVAGRYALFPLFQSREPEELTVTWNGLSMRFSQSTTPGLKGFEPGPDNAADIVFDGGIRLRVSPGADTGGSMTLSPVGAGAGGAYAALVVPFRVAGALDDSSAGTALAWHRAGRTFRFTLPGSARTDLAAGTLTLPLSGPAWSGTLQVEGAPVVARQSAAGSPPRARLPDEASLPSEEGLHAALAAFTDAAYRGWSESRYLAADARWQLADGTAGFAEDIGVGLLAESIRRGTWRQMFPLWSSALAAQQGRTPQAALSFVTSAYVGGEKDFASASPARIAQQLAQVGALLD